jgi:hypothetical protein
MINPFRSIHDITDATHGPRHARQLAAAFLAVQFDADPNASAENFAQLSTALRAVGHMAGNTDVLFRYLNGAQFDAWQTEEFKFEPGNIGALQVLARQYEQWAKP